MRKGAIFICFVSILLTSVVSSAFAGWHQWPQTTRNQAIVDRAFCDVDSYVGLDCKNWVRRVVYSVSGGLVTIPSTYPNADGYSWYPSTDVVGLTSYVRWVKPGWIIQMNWRQNSGVLTTHTAIVVGVFSYGMYLVESNWSAKNVVSLRYVSFSEFEAHVGSRYSVYYIL